MMNEIKKIGIIKDERYLWHRAPHENRECPDRISAIYNELKNCIFSDRLKIFSPKIIDDETICTVHSSFYLKQILEYSIQSNVYHYDKDTYLMSETPYVAKLAVGGCLALADAIMNGEVDKGFALVRPPGHHAEVGRAMGFCIFNNIALTAQYLIDNYNLDRILIIDFDAHSGNGTQEIFYENSKVLFLSVHQSNLFPFTGKGQDIGSGAGEGYTVNLPVPAYFGDQEYSYIFGRAIQNIAENYLPQIILVSAGFDGHRDDSMSKLEITDDGYKNITKSLIHFANKYSNGRLLYVLEGGYNISSLLSSVNATFEAFVDNSNQLPGFMFSERAQKVIESEIPEKIKIKWGI